MEQEFDITVDWRGFELHSETPAGGIPLSKLFPEVQPRDKQEQMKEFAASFGIENMVLPEILPNTHRILAMAEYAREMDTLDAFRTLAMQARWEENRNLEDDGVLGDLAAASGLDPQKALAACDSADYLARVDSLGAVAKRMEVTGVPAFIIGETRVIGCQHYQVLADAVCQAGGSPRK